jgi:hypothetical protein
MLPTRLLRVAVVVLAVVTAACGDPTKPRATYASTLSSYTLYAITGAPVNAPTAINFLTGAARADARFNFDVGFDLDNSGRVLVYPVRAIAGALAGNLKRVGLQPLAGAFASIREVPASGYDTLAVQTVTPGKVLAVELLDYNTCYASFGGSTLYAKLVIDSVNATARRLYARAVVDLNCGYRQVVPDSIPTS